VNDYAKDLSRQEDGDPWPVSPFPDIHDTSLFTLLASQPPAVDQWLKELEPYFNSTDLERAKQLLWTLINKGFTVNEFNRIIKDDQDYGSLTLTLYNLYGNESKELRFLRDFMKFKQILEEEGVSLKSCSRSGEKLPPAYSVDLKFLQSLASEKEEERDEQPTDAETSTVKAVRPST